MKLLPMQFLLSQLRPSPAPTEEPSVEPPASLTFEPAASVYDAVLEVDKGYAVKLSDAQITIDDYPLYIDENESTQPDFTGLYEMYCLSSEYRIPVVYDDNQIVCAKSGGKFYMMYYDSGNQKFIKYNNTDVYALIAT